MSQHSISSAEDGIKWDGSSGRVLLLLRAKQASFLSAICSGECGRLNDGERARLSIWMRVRMGKRVRYFAITIKEPEGGRRERERGD